MPFLRKYATAAHVYIPIVKRAVVDFAVSADWTPAAGDVKISIDGAAAANVTNLPAAITMGNTAMWDFSLTSGELTGKKIVVTVSDSATKAVEDQMFLIETYGNSSGEYAADWTDGVRLGLTALPNVASGAAGAIPTTGTGANQISVSSGQVILQAGTGTGQLDFTSGVVKANLVQILATALTETAGQIAAGFKKFFNVATPTFDLTAVNQTGDSFARIGANGAGLTNLAPAATALSNVQWTNARAGYLDNLNVGGAVASHADVVAVNQSASKHLLLVTVGQYEPGETYTIEMRTFAAADGSAVNADTTPTLTATGQVSGSLSANLSAATNPATGVYRWTYTPGASPTLEQIRFDGSATISAATFTLSCYSQTIDEATAVLTATDIGHITSIFNKLPAGNIGDATAANQTTIINDVTALGSPMQAGTAVQLAATQPNYAPAKAGDAMALTTAERSAVANALLDLADAIETGITPRQAHRALLAALCGKLITAGSNPEVYQNPAGTANRISIANDASGNRTAVTLTL